MSTSLLAKYGQTISYTDFDDEQCPLYAAHQAGIPLPHPWRSSHYRQANLDYLAKHYPEFLI